MRNLIVLLGFVYLSIAGYSQNCHCDENLTFAIKTVENDYAGFKDKVDKKHKKEYIAFKNRLLERAKEINNATNRCNNLLRQYLDYFKDNHLYVEMRQNINFYFTFQQIDSTTSLIRIPSFDSDDKAIIDSLVSKNMAVLSKSSILIIDLRGNRGGIDDSFKSLLPLIYTNPYVMKGVEWRASEGNINYFEDCLKNGTYKVGKEKEIQEQINQMKKHQGGFVTIGKEDTIYEQTVMEKPLKVGIIANDYCASSCEEFILMAKNSRKVTVFGISTAGTLDYSNTIPVAMPTKGMVLRYPMTRSKRLPENPIDNVGIAPDVKIDLPDNFRMAKDKADDWVLFAVNYLKANN
ncbi:MAG: S41 family peptidase [Bacteroidota bacterium]|nr:S41 family peptidase [Bacteroidota bacterium]